MFISPVKLDRLTMKHMESYLEYRASCWLQILAAPKNYIMTTEVNTTVLKL